MAPGADRYTINLELLILSKNISDNDAAFIAGHESVYDSDDYVGDTLFLLEVDNNAVVQVARPEFAGITDVLADRTREESGDYTLDPYVIDITGFYNDVESDSVCDRGLYSIEEMGDSDVEILDSDVSGVAAGQLALKSDADKEKFGESRFLVGVEPSISYVDGYRVAEPEKIYVMAEKARKTSEYKQSYSDARLGSYILGDVDSIASTGAPSFDVDDVATIKDGTLTTLATCRFRSLENTGGSQLKLYVYDIQFASGVTSLDGAATIEQGTFVYTVADATLYDTEYNKSIYPLPADYIEHVKSSTGDIEFTNRRVFDPTSTVGDTVVISVSGETDAKFEELGPDSYIVIDGDGTVYTTDSTLRSVNNDSVTITTTENIATAIGTKVIASYRARLDLKSKTKATITDKVLVAENTDVAAGAEFDLDHHDIIAITSAEDFAGMPISLTDLVLDNGQRDGCYKKGRVKYIGEGLTAAGAGTGGLKITYTYFVHGTGDYFSVSSYSGVEYDEIPIYKDMRLSDSLDFRPRLGGGDSGTHLDPNSTIDSQIRYYLSRIDKLVVTRNSEFKLITGVPEVFPEEPAVPADSMHLYTLYIPAYTFCHTRIDTLFVDNRRYTMRDIGGLSSRIDSLEQYTVLSMLEKDASSKQIFDGGTTSYDRFKNGIIVDSFRGHNVGNVLDEHYNCSMSAANPILRPYFLNRSVPFTRSTTIGDTVNVAVNDGLATLEYESGFAWIDQQKAAVSISVNPYDVATWLGSFKLSPSSDEWMETRRAPNIVNEVGGNLADLRAQVNRINQLGTQWNSWQTAWTGTPVSTRTIERAPRRWPIRRVTTTTTQSQQIRTGNRTVGSISSITRVADDRVIDVSFVPFIRARKVYFKGKLFKPNTKLRVFFDGKDITKYATSVVEADYKEWSENASVRTYHNDLTPAGAGAADIVTNFKGDIYGWFVVPNNSEYQFPIGERTVVLTDGVSATDPGATTSADTVYTASGKVQTKQRTLITTRSVVRRQQRVTQSRLQTSTAVSRTRWYDPLAQSFIIGENPTGIFIHSVDLYFSHVSEKNIPIKMYLVEMENGYPTQRRVPLSDVTKQPDEVATSSDATAATTFEFDSPIYLQYGMEYAIVTESNSSHYRQWLSEVGKNDVTTGEFISKNPFLGVSFKSQNASTWSADQMKDFKMVVRRATYQSEGSIILNAVGISDAVDDESDGPLEFSQVQLNTDFIDHPETDISYKIKIGTRDWEVIVPNENHYVSTGSTAIEANTDVKLMVTLKSNDEKITPIVDLDRISLIAVKNVINSEATIGTTEEASDHGLAEAVYMTKEVILNNPSDRLDSYLNINRPYLDSNVLVYARFKRSEDNIEDIDFDLIPSSIAIPLSDREDYTEIQYTKDFSEGTEALFESFQIKIVMVSNDHAIIPTVRDFRAIATV